jgi:hypothetical protein
MPDSCVITACKAKIICFKDLKGRNRSRNMASEPSVEPLSTIRYGSLICKLLAGLNAFYSVLPSVPVKDYDIY